MPAWNDYKRIAKERGSLALELYVVESTPIEPMDKVKEILPDHLAYQQSLEESGSLAFAGPLSDETGELMQGVGLIVYRAVSLSSAKDLAENDPMHVNGVRSYSIRKWLINEGSVNIKLGLSTNKAELS